MSRHFFIQSVVKPNTAVTLLYRSPALRASYMLLVQVWVHVRGAVASLLVRLTPERAVRVRALAGKIVLCSWARHFTLAVPLSTQVYKWVPANCWGKPNKLRGSDLRWTSIPSRGSRNTSAASCYRNRDKLRPDGPHWPVCRFYLFTYVCSLWPASLFFPFFNESIGLCVICARLELYSWFQFYSTQLNIALGRGC